MRRKFLTQVTVFSFLSLHTSPNNGATNRVVQCTRYTGAGAQGASAAFVAATYTMLPTSGVPPKPDVFPLRTLLFTRSFYGLEMMLSLAITINVKCRVVAKIYQIVVLAKRSPHYIENRNTIV